jgi:tetratricopeptide (TPR) repeat protein
LQGNYDESRRFVLEALEMLEQAMHERQDGGVGDAVSLNRGEAEAHMQGDHMPTGRPQGIAPTMDEAHAGLGEQQGNDFSGFQTLTERAILGAPLEVGLAYELLGIIAVNVGQFAEALAQFHRALAIFEQHDLVTALAQVYSNLGAVHAVKSENTMALTYMQRSLKLAERLGNQPNVAMVTGNLGEMAARSGNLRQAEEWFRRSLAVAERMNEAEQISWCNVALGATLQDQGNLAGAAECIRRSLSIARAMKSTRNTGGALVALADLRIVQAIIACELQKEEERAGNIPQMEMRRRFMLRAKSTIQRALALEGLETELIVEGRMILANVHFLLGDIEKAKQEALRIMEEAKQYELSRMLARSNRLLGLILAAQGDSTQANAHFEQALRVFRERELRLDYARALHGYGVSLIERHTPEEAQFNKGLTYLQEARDIFADSHAAIDLEWVEHKLKRYKSETAGA